MTDNNEEGSPIASPRPGPSGVQFLKSNTVDIANKAATCEEDEPLPLRERLMLKWNFQQRPEGRDFQSIIFGIEPTEGDIFQFAPLKTIVLRNPSRHKYIIDIQHLFPDSTRITTGTRPDTAAINAAGRTAVGQQNEAVTPGK